MKNLNIKTEVSMNEHNTFHSEMNRRTFIKVSSSAVLSIGGALLLPSVSYSSSPEKAFKLGEKPILIRGNRSGQILESLDSGKTWKVNADFGRGCSVKAIRVAGDGLVVRVEHKGFSFSLRSKNGRDWIT